MHAVGASMSSCCGLFGIYSVVYIMALYKTPRELLWANRFSYFPIHDGYAFMDMFYLGDRMSYWGATVITNLFSAIPLIGESIYMVMGWIFSC